MTRTLTCDRCHKDTDHLNPIGWKARPFAGGGDATNFKDGGHP